MTTHKKTPKVHPTDASADDEAEAAFNRVLPLLSSVEIPNEPLRIDFEAAGLAATGVAGRVNAGPLKARFLALNDADFEKHQLTALPDQAWALYYIGRQYKLLRDNQSEAKLPVTLVTSATQVEGRLQRLCEYYYPNDADVIALRPGNDYRDLAGDLLGYVKKVRANLPTLSHDPVNFRASDLDDGPRLAKQILTELASANTTETQLAFLQASQCFVLLQPTYEDVCATGLWLERKDPKAADRYPGLYAAARPGAGGRRSTSTTSTGGTATGDGGSTPTATGSVTTTSAGPGATGKS